MGKNLKINRREFIKKSVQTTSALAGATGFSVSAMQLDQIQVGENEYDYIIVGAGAGGGVIASRLAQAKKRVLLLEAGSDSFPEISEVPAFHASASEDPEVAWRYFVKHYSDETMHGSKWQPGKGMMYPRGSGLGGSTLVNAMITMTPTGEDMAQLTNASGDPGWNARDFSKYYERVISEHYFKPRVNGHQILEKFLKLHRDNPWLAVEQSPMRFVFQDKYIWAMVWAAAKKVGIVEELFNKLGNGLFINLDPNDPMHFTRAATGLFNTPKATLVGRRNGTRDLIQRTKESSEYGPYLKIETNALVSELIIDPETKKVKALKYYKGNDTYQASIRFQENEGEGQKRRDMAQLNEVKVKGEVILCAGAFNTPQILLRSGIGPQSEFQRMNWSDRQVHNLPGVGRNLQDRYEVGVVNKWKKGKSIELLKDCNFGSEDDGCLALWRNDRRGRKKHLYGTNGVTIGVKHKSDAAKSIGQREPDLFLFAVPGYFKGYYPGYSKENSKRLDRFTWAVLKAHTINNTGEVRLKSKSPFDTPDINFKYFNDGQDLNNSDMEAMIEAVGYVRDMVKGSKTLGRLMVDEEEIPGPDIRTKEELREFVATEAWGHHASCSCPMGLDPNEGAVVDGKFKVHGIDGLRVVDASIFPKIPGMFIALPIFMVAERAVDLILGQE